MNLFPSEAVITVTKIHDHQHFIARWGTPARDAHSRNTQNTLSI